MTIPPREVTAAAAIAALQKLKQFVADYDAGKIEHEPLNDLVVRHARFVLADMERGGWAAALRDDLKEGR